MLVHAGDEEIYGPSCQWGNLKQPPAGANVTSNAMGDELCNFWKYSIGVNDMDGQLNGGSSITASSLLRNPMSNSPTALRSDEHLHEIGNGVHVNGLCSLTPHAQPASLLLNSRQALCSPRFSTFGMPSLSLQQQAVKSTRNSF